MGNIKTIKVDITMLRGNLATFRSRLIRANNTQFEPNLSEKRRITSSIKSMRRTLSNLNAML